MIAVARIISGGVVLLLGFSRAEAAVAWPKIAVDTDTLATGILVMALIVVCWAFFSTRRVLRRERLVRQRVDELEAQLNDAEAALTAEPHVLVVWRDRDGEPERIVGTMRGAAQVPEEPERLLSFETWLDSESADALSASIADMRQNGTAFNIGVRTLANDLVEADGRVAGGLATLRLRPLAGERKKMSELAYDTRRLGKQVERLSGMLDAAPLPVWLRDSERKLIWANRAYIKAVEAPDVGAIVSGGIELIRSERLETTAEPIQAGLLGRGHVVIAGAKRALDVHELDLADGVAGFAVDVTELEEAEKELDRHTRAHASTLDKLDTAIAIFGADQRLRFHNAAYAELWSLDPDWLGSGPAEGEILDRLRAERRLPEQANYRDWRARQLQAYTTLETRESWWYLPDGRSLHVICEQHPFGGVTYLYENATKEIQLESRYNELIEVQRETLDNLREGLVLFGTDGRLRLYNPAFAKLWSLESAKLEAHPHVEEIVASTRRLHDDDAMWDELKYGVTGLDTGRKPMLGRLKRNDGMVLEFASVPLGDGNTLLTYVDVTDSARIEEALRERAEALEAADRLKTGFMSNVSYELRTPLTNILGFSESLALGIAGALEAKQQDYVRHIQTSSQDLLAIIDAILDLTTIDAGAMELALDTVDVARAMEETAQSLAEWIGKRDLTLTIEVAEDATSFRGDQKRVRQIIHNLLTNAIGFSTEGGSVRMGTRRDGNDVLLWVADTGKGIDPEFQKRAFDRFQSSPVLGGHRGPGLGLAIVKSFVELHDGKVSLLSQVNKGTTVVCRFPAEGPRSKPPSSYQSRSGPMAAA
jgi:signal transduction histidine kinase